MNEKEVIKLPRYLTVGEIEKGKRIYIRLKKAGLTQKQANDTIRKYKLGLTKRRKTTKRRKKKRKSIVDFGW